jgi:hypothetical protein
MTTPVRIGMRGRGIIGEFHARGVRHVREAVLTVGCDASEARRWPTG